MNGRAWIAWMLIGLLIGFALISFALDYRRDLKTKAERAEIHRLLKDLGRPTGYE